MTSQVRPPRDPGGLRARLDARRSAVIATAGRYGAHNVRLAGSLARGDHTEASDIDLLVDFVNGVGLFKVARLVAELEELLESHVDVVSANSLRPWDDDVPRRWRSCGRVSARRSPVRSPPKDGGATKSRSSSVSVVA